MIFLVAVSRCAGLHTEMHRCAWIEAAVERSWAASALAALPVEVTDAGEGWTRLRGLPQAILEFLLFDMASDLTRDGIRYGQEECRCRVKTAIIPEEELEGWRAALRDGPFGGAAVKHAYPCLGVTVAGRSIGPGPGNGDWHPAAMAQVQIGTWQRPGDKAIDRPPKYARTRRRQAIVQCFGTLMLPHSCCTQGRLASRPPGSGRLFGASARLPSEQGNGLPGGSSAAWVSSSGSKGRPNASRPPPPLVSWLGFGRAGGAHLRPGPNNKPNGQG